MNSSPAATCGQYGIGFLGEPRTEMTLEQAHEIPLADMNQAELQVVILHDPDLSVRRQALRLFKLEILLDAETRIMRALTEARK
jgi:hypothetical protein